MSNPSLLFDIGGTNMRVGISLDGKKIESPRIVPTPQSYAEGVKAFGQVCNEILASTKPSVVVGGIAGSLSADKTQVYNSPHLPDWRNKPFVDDLKKGFGCPVYLENDTALVGLGEAVYGAGKGYSTVGYVTVSTGVNGVKVEDGKISKNYLGYEIGHHIMDFNASLTNIEFGRGEFEDFVGGAAIEKRTGMSPLQIQDPNLWSTTASFLVVGLYNCVLFWSPEMLIVGGPIVTKIPFNSIKLALSERLKTIYPETPAIVQASLGEFGGLHGAMVCANQLDGSQIQRV
jgi:glucokinase